MRYECAQCHRKRDLIHYHRDSTAPKGHKPYCDDCKSDLNFMYKLTRRGRKKTIEAKRRYRFRHRERLNAARRVKG
jgi:hypothetical protein